MLRAHAAPPIVDGQLLPEPRNVLGRSLAANRVVVVPPDVCQVSDLVNAATLADPTVYRARLLEREGALR